jgi:S-sulfo-L-cysteine synthase (O-acetyl-L-serine-dependent)
MKTILDLVGNTPLVELTKINPNPKVKIYGKLEGNNPGGSVKDRAAYNMIKGALERGD